jgi:hypothetical protein
MSLYREAGRRSTGRLVAIAAAVLVAGLAIGFGIGRATEPDPTAADVVAQLRSDLQPVANGLEILPTEYPQAREGAGNETAAVQGGLDRIRTALRAAAPDLRTLDPSGLQDLQTAVDRLAEAVEAKAAPAQVERLTQRATTALQAVPGGR